MSEPRERQPAWIEPELAAPTKGTFSDPAWIFERKLDGERCLAFRDEQTRLMTRNQKQGTAYPELAGALAAQQARDFIVDGEVVAFDDSRTSFARLQRRLGVRHPPSELIAEVPVCYYLFDLLWADGRDWLKFKCENGQEFVIGGYTDPRGSRSGFGALLLGYYDPAGELTYAGKVGSGFDRLTLESLHKMLASMERDQPAFARGEPPRTGVHWVEPNLVGQVAFTEWTADGQLRHPRFQGLRRDKEPAEVVREAAS